MSHFIHVVLRIDICNLTCIWCTLYMFVLYSVCYTYLVVCVRFGLYRYHTGMMYYMVFTRVHVRAHARGGREESGADLGKDGCFARGAPGGWAAQSRAQSFELTNF